MSVSGRTDSPVPSFDRFETPRLCAERLQPAHLEELCEMDADPQVMQFLGGPRSQRESAEYLRWNLEHWTTHGHGLWILRRRTDGNLVGRAYLRYLVIGGNREVAIGYALIPQSWGMGLATEIAAAIVESAFTKLKVGSLVVAARPDNLASLRVIEKIGGVFDREITYKGAPHLLYRITSPDAGASAAQRDP